MNVASSSYPAPSHAASMSPPMVPILNEPHPIHGLVQQHLPRNRGVLAPAVKVHPNIPVDDVRFALTRVGTGLDHTIGEQAMALGEFSLDPKGQPYTVFLLVTDRRFIGTVGLATGKVCDVRFSAIDEVRFKKKLLTIDLQVRAGDQWHDLSFGDYDEPIRSFLRPLYEQPKERREPVPRPLCAPTEDDPTGATMAMAWMPEPHPRTALLLTYVRESARREALPLHAAQDLVTRIALAYRNRCFGRGCHQGRAMSPASADDLSQIMVHLFGNPLQHAEHPVRTLVFPSKMKTDLGASAVSSAIGLTALAVVGVGWTRTPRASVGSFGFMVADTGPFASYRLMQTGGMIGLHRKVPGFADDIHFNLMGLEEAMLLRRAVYGWNVAAADLMAADPSDIVARLTDVVGPFDPALLG